MELCDKIVWTAIFLSSDAGVLVGKMLIIIKFKIN